MDNRFFYAGEMSQGDIVELSEKESQHFLLVRRAKIGDNCILFNGDGNDYICSVVTLKKRTIEVKVDAIESNKNVTKAHFTLFVGATKNEALDDAINSAVQLNISNIVIFYSEYTNAKIDEHRIEKINANIIQRAKQCERASLPRVEIVTFAQLVSRMQGFDVKAVAYENAGKSIAFETKKRIALIVGSEGGFSEKEIEALVSAGVQSISLGKTILRVPTACTALVSIAMFLAGEMHR